jgi:hypothetical protein
VKVSNSTLRRLICEEIIRLTEQDNVIEVPAEQQGQRENVYKDIEVDIAAIQQQLVSLAEPVSNIIERLISHIAKLRQSDQGRAV